MAVLKLELNLTQLESFLKYENVTRHGFKYIIDNPPIDSYYTR